VYRTALAAAAALALAACADDSVRPAPGAAPNLARSSTSQGIARVKPVGDPIWRPVDFHLFTAPIGDVGNGYAEFAAMGGRIMPPPRHAPVGSFAVGPGVPHAGAYDRELANGLRALGIRDERTFPASAFTAESRNGVYLVWMFVPDPGIIGRSPDVAAGPIIPNSLFPIILSGVVYRDGRLFDPALFGGDAPVPGIDASVDPRFAGVQGHSHLPVFVAETQAFFPFPYQGTLYPRLPAEGKYEYVIRMRDRQGHGWDVTVQYHVRKK
jgi:hypothetical protein